MISAKTVLPPYAGDLATITALPKPEYPLAVAERLIGLEAIPAKLHGARKMSYYSLHSSE
jgi:hypothetical protein